jgi:putative tryptophan/tyrosine transport system substrate-binding protein
MTGVAFVPTPAVTGKVVELFTQALPSMSRIALLWNPDSVGNERYFDEARRAATSLKLTVQSLAARNSQEIDAALAAIVRERAEGLVIVAEAPLTIHRARIIEHAAQRGIPTASYLPEFADSGSVLAYGPSPTEQLRRAAGFVDRVLKGAKPADLPVEQPTTFTFVVNQSPHCWPARIA